MDRKGKKVEVNQGMGSEDVNLGERWYNIENLVAKHRSISHLEHELDAAF